MSLTSTHRGQRRGVAVVGAGVAGLTAGYLLQRSCDARGDDVHVEITRTRDPHAVFRASLTGRPAAAAPLVPRRRVPASRGRAAGMGLVKLQGDPVVAPAPAGRPPDPAPVQEEGVQA